MTDEVLLDTKVVHIGMMHGFAANGGIIKFKNFPFAIRMSGINSTYANLQLVAIPQGKVSTTKINSGAKKVDNKPKIEISEDESEEM